MASPAGSQAGGMILRTRPASRGPIGARVWARTQTRQGAPPWERCWDRKSSRRPSSHRASTRCSTSWAARIYDARRIPEHLATAFRQATTGRVGPVYLDLPGDVLGEKVDESRVVYPPAWKTLPRARGDEGAVKEAIALLAKASRPIVLGGSGVWWSDA